MTNRIYKKTKKYTTLRISRKNLWTLKQIAAEQKKKSLNKTIEHLIEKYGKLKEFKTPKYQKYQPPQGIVLSNTTE